jgi:uncharacterized LabA/DUF88 family protein
MILDKYLKGKILVVIDAANLESAVQSLNFWIDYIKLRELFDKNRLVEIRDYCVQHNTNNQNKFFTFLKKNGYKLITKPLKIIKTSDFDYLIRKLRAKGKKVIVISTKHHISKELIESSNKYIDIKKLRKLIERKR